MSGASALVLNNPAATSPTRRGIRKRTASKQSGTPLRERTPQHGHRPPPAASAGDVLGRYPDSRGRPHEIVVRAGAGGSVLVIDRDAVTFGDRRLVAHLAPDEPAENARVVCDQYLADARRGCRPVTSADLETIPDPECDQGHDQAEAPHRNLLVDRHGHSYHLEPVRTRMLIPEMRWQQYPPERRAGPPRVLTVRDVIAALESYEPVRTLTRQMVVRHRHDARVSVSVLRGEIQRFCVSRFVLNRGLREAALATAKADGLSMSEIAMRCGRVKRDSRGNACGDTSWLSRRLGLTPEGGENSPTPWVDSDVLALIARQGLSISPREVELG
ncbi:MAG: hypothetical protein ABSH36_04950 [Solirubrobacteraceae bacterium]